MISLIMQKFIIFHDHIGSLNFQYPQYSVNEGDDKILNLILNTALSTTVVVDLIYEESGS